MNNHGKRSSEGDEALYPCRAQGWASGEVHWGSGRGDRIHNLASCQAVEINRFFGFWYQKDASELSDRKALPIEREGLPAFS